MLSLCHVAQIVDPKKASYGVENPLFAVTQLAQTTMRSDIGKISLDKTFAERDTLNKNIVEAIRCLNPCSALCMPCGHGIAGRHEQMRTTHSAGRAYQFRPGPSCREATSDWGIECMRYEVGVVGKAGTDRQHNYTLCRKWQGAYAFIGSLPAADQRHCAAFWRSSCYGASGEAYAEELFNPEPSGRP